MAIYCLITYQQLHNLSLVTPVKFTYFTGDRYFTGEVHPAISAFHQLSSPCEALNHHEGREKPFVLPNCDTFAKINRPLDDTMAVVNDASRIFAL